MKKQLFTVAAIGVAVCCLGACKKSQADNSEWAALNAMLDYNYSQIEISVTDTFDEYTSLKSEYVIDYSDSQITVTYSVEKFVEISLGNPVSNEKTTFTGKAFINGGSIALIGDDIDITADIADIGLTFKKSYFRNVNLTGNYLNADVENVSKFIGSKLVCSNMKVEAFFLEVFDNIKINYVSAIGSSVEIYIDFTL